MCLTMVIAGKNPTKCRFLLKCFISLRCAEILKCIIGNLELGLKFEVQEQFCSLSRYFCVIYFWALFFHHKNLVSNNFSKVSEFFQKIPVLKEGHGNWSHLSLQGHVLPNTKYFGIFEQFSICIWQSIYICCVRASPHL